MPSVTARNRLPELKGLPPTNLGNRHDPRIVNLIRCDRIDAAPVRGTCGG